MAKATSLKSYGDCEGPLGFPMRSDVAKEVEDLIASLPKECAELIQKGPMRVTKVATSVSFNEDERADVSFITTDSIDRDREVMLPSGADWKQFRKNAIVTFAHKYDELPVGRNLWLKRDTQKSMEGWLGKTQYVERPKDWPASAGWFPDAVWHMVHEKILLGKSIGFIPTEISAPTPDEIKKRPELAEASRIIRKWTALEYAVAPVQSNPDALLVAVAKAKRSGVTIPDTLVETMGLVLPETPGTLVLGPEWKAHEEVTKPYPNEHAARLTNPDKYIRFRRENDKFGSGIHAIFGVTKESKVELQSIHFDAKKFSVVEAKKWLKDHGHHPILFEPAPGEEKEVLPSLPASAILEQNAVRKYVFDRAIGQSVSLEDVAKALRLRRGRVV